MPKSTFQHGDAPKPPAGQTNATVDVRMRDVLDHNQPWKVEKAPVPETHPFGHYIGIDPVTGKERAKNALGQWLDEEAKPLSPEDLIRELPADSMVAAKVRAQEARKSAAAQPTVSEVVDDDPSGPIRTDVDARGRK